MIRNEGCNVLIIRKAFIRKAKFEQRAEGGKVASCAKNRGKLFSGRDGLVQRFHAGSVPGVFEGHQEGHLAGAW